MLNGILNVYKEKGFTSFDVVAKLRGMTKQKKLGHTGTLDPDAEGVLPVCFGKATKVCDLLTEKDKEYIAVLRLGVETDTQDLTGRVLKQQEVNLNEQTVYNVIMKYVGNYEQIPPMYSALKVNGQKLCDLAREGIEIERKPRTVQIHEIEILKMELPAVTMKVHCSKGTYIRTLCHDIGKDLACGGAMESLLRTRVSVFQIENAYRFEDIQTMLMENTLEEHMVFVDQLFETYKSATVREEYNKFVNNGNRLKMEYLLTEDSESLKTKIRVYNMKNEFVGIYSFDEQRQDFKLIKMFKE